MLALRPQAMRDVPRNGQILDTTASVGVLARSFVTA